MVIHFISEKLLKFGGSSVSNARNIDHAADVIVDQYVNGRYAGYNGCYFDLGVVVSAVGSQPGVKEPKITDQMLAAHASAIAGQLDSALENIERIKQRH